MPGIRRRKVLPARRLCAIRLSDMAGISIIEDTPRKSAPDRFTGSDVERWGWFESKLPEWQAGRLTKFADLAKFGPEVLLLIRKLMAYRKISGAELARRIGSHPTYMSRAIGTRNHFDIAAPKTKTIISMMSALEPEIRQVVGMPPEQPRIWGKKIKQRKPAVRRPKAKLVSIEDARKRQKMGDQNVTG